MFNLPSSLLEDEVISELDSAKDFSAPIGIVTEFGCSISISSSILNNNEANL